MPPTSIRESGSARNNRDHSAITAGRSLLTRLKLPKVT